MSRVGILGGTFNPPHLGHLLCADAALTQAGPDRVLLMPVSSPPHKQLRDDPGPEIRLRLCELAVAADDRIAVSDIELRRGGTSYTVDTLRELERSSPEDEPVLIVGGDVAQGLPSWREPEAILALAGLVVAEREGIRRQDVLDRVADLAGSERIEFIDMVRFDVSSSSVRRRVAMGESIRYLVPEPVRAEIESNRWYTKGRPDA